MVASCLVVAYISGQRCLFQATSCVKDQRHRNFVMSHSEKFTSIISVACAEEEEEEEVQNT